MIEVFNRERSQRLQRGRNLRVLRERAGKYGAKQVHIVKTPAGGQLTIHFGDDSYSVVNFASYAVMCRTLRNWRNLHGAELWGRLNGNAVLIGFVAPRHPHLASATYPAY